MRRTAILLWLAAMLTFAPAAQADGKKPYQIFGDNNGYVHWASALACDADGNLWVGCQNAHELVKLSPAGEILLRVPSEYAINTIELLPDGKILFLTYSKIWKIHSNGAKCSHFDDHSSNRFAPAGRLSAFAVDSKGRIIVAFPVEKMLRRYNPDTSLDETFADKGTRKLDFSPDNIRMHDGRLYVVNYKTNKLYLLTAEGKPTGEYAAPEGCNLHYAMHIDAERIFLASSKPAMFLVLDHNLKLLKELKVPGRFPRSITTDASGNIYFGTDHGEILAFTRTYEPRNEFSGNNCMTQSAQADERFALPGATAIDRDGNLLVCGYGSNRIQVINPKDGSFIRKFQTRLPYMRALAVDKAGNIYAGCFVYGTVSKYTPEGKFVWKKGKVGKKPGEFKQISEMRFTPNGHLLIAEGTGARVQAMTTEMKPAPIFGGTNILPLQWDGSISYGSGVAADTDGNIYISHQRGLPEVRNPDGAPANRYKWRRDKKPCFGGRSDYRYPLPDQFKNPGSIAVAKNGDVFVVDRQLANIKRFNANGALTGLFGSFGYLPGQFRMPCGLTLDGKGNLFVCDMLNSRVYKIDIDRAFAFDVK